jgi:hypothetical protein
MASSTTDRLIRLLLDVAETSKRSKVKLAAVEKIMALRQSQKRRGPAPKPKPLSEVERLLGANTGFSTVHKTDKPVSG